MVTTTGFRYIYIPSTNSSYFHLLCASLGNLKKRKGISFMMIHKAHRNKLDTFHDMQKQQIKKRILQKYGKSDSCTLVYIQSFSINQLTIMDFYYNFYSIFYYLQYYHSQRLHFRKNTIRFIIIRSNCRSDKRKSFIALIVCIIYIRHPKKVICSILIQ